MNNNNNNKKEIVNKRRGRRARTYLILDTETATLPFANEIATNPIEKRTIAIAKPLVYDIAWKIVDRNGKVYSKHSYLVSEIFSVPSVFNTAYYHEKRPIYLERLKKGETTIKHWNEIMEILQADLQDVDFVGAFNSMFDYKKAIPFTEKYINALYSPDYHKWEYGQRCTCEKMIKEKSKWKNPDWDKMNFNFRGADYPLIDLWGIACEMLINTQTYKRKCLQHGMITESGQFFKSSAETTFRYLCDKFDFEEAHMAIDDVNIECQILQKALKKGKITEGLVYFPFKILGNTTDFIRTGSKRKIPVEEVEVVIKKIQDKLETYVDYSSYATYLERDLLSLIEYLNSHHKGKHIYSSLGINIEMTRIARQGTKLKKELATVKTDKAFQTRIEKLKKLREKYAELREEYRIKLKEEEEIFATLEKKELQGSLV